MIIKAGLYSVGGKFADSLVNMNWDSIVQSDDMLRLNCYDSVMAPVFSEEIELTRKSGDSIGSTVECVIEGLPMGIGEPWFDGLEPALARVMMAIPGARAVEFSKGFQSSTMKGSEHNDAWTIRAGQISPSSDSGNLPDGALGGRSTGAPSTWWSTSNHPAASQKHRRRFIFPVERKPP